MSKKLDKLIKSLKEAKEILNKDDMDEKIKAKMMAEMKRRNFTEADATRHVIDRDRGAKMPKPPKAPKPLLQSEDAQMQIAKTEAARALLKKEEKKEEVKKSALDLADDLIKSLQKAGGDVVQPKRSPVGGQTGWSQDPASGAFHHKIHGVVSTFKEPNGQYSVKHNGKTLGTHPTIQDAGAKVKEHMGWLASFKGGAGTAKMAPTMKEESSMDGDCDPVYKSNKTPEEIAEQKVMDHLAKTVGAMMPQSNRKLQPTQDEFEAAMIAQGMAVTQEQADQLNKSWDNAMTGWFAEAMKPISSKFKSEEEEEAYWANIKVNQNGGDISGY